MDVLQLLKTELKERLFELNELSEMHQGPHVQGILGRLKAHLRLESAYLLPELMAMSVKNEPVLSRLESEVEAIEMMLDSIHVEHVDSLQISELRTAFLAHIQCIEERILPLMRQKITTAAREELFFVLQDAKHDLVKAASVELAI